MNFHFEEAKRVRRGRKALSRLERICNEAGVMVDVPKDAETTLRNKELNLVVESIRTLSPEEILSNLRRFTVFTYR